MSTRWAIRIAVVLALAASGVVAFATIAPDPREVEALLVRTSTVESIPVRPEQVLPDSGLYVREERFQRGETISGFLARLGVSEVERGRLAKVQALRQLRPGLAVRADIAADGAPHTLSFLGLRDTLVQVIPSEDQYKTAEYPAPVEKRTAMKTGVVRTSLFAATDAAGIPDAVAIQLAEIFSGDVDFYRELRKGDRFSVVYEELQVAGVGVRSGRVLAA
ncbi:MAG: hypothetical protein JO035_07275, partial [Betaproteobacteria bacterium]|nr:hypothetical protein [Betaproteobacteria bacterium]